MFIWSHINTWYTHLPCGDSDRVASLNVSADPPLHSGVLCVTSPGLNYVFMGQVDEEGRGKIAPHHFVMVFKTKNQKVLNVLKNKQC